MSLQIPGGYIALGENQSALEDEIPKDIAISYDVYEQACCYQIYEGLLASDSDGYVTAANATVDELLQDQDQAYLQYDPIPETPRAACNRKRRTGADFNNLDDDANNYFRFIRLNSCYQKGDRSRRGCIGRYTWFYTDYLLKTNFLISLFRFFLILFKPLIKGRTISETLKFLNNKINSDRYSKLITESDGFGILYAHDDSTKGKVFESSGLTLPLLIKLYQLEPGIFYMPHDDANLRKTQNYARDLFNSAFFNVPPLPRNLMVFRCDKTRSLTRRSEQDAGQNPEGNFPLESRSIFDFLEQDLKPGVLSLEFGRLLSTTVSQYFAISSEFCYDSQLARDQQTLYKRTQENAGPLGNCRKYQTHTNSVLAILIPKGSRVIPIYPPGSFDATELARPTGLCRAFDKKPADTEATSTIAKHEKEVILALNARLLYTGFCYKSPLDLSSNYLPLLIYIDPLFSEDHMNPLWQRRRLWQSNKYDYKVDRPDRKELLDLFKNIAKGFNEEVEDHMVQFEQIYKSYADALANSPYPPPPPPPPLAGGRKSRKRKSRKRKSRRRRTDCKRNCRKSRKRKFNQETLGSNHLDKKSAEISSK